MRGLLHNVGVIAVLIMLNPVTQAATVTVKGNVTQPPCEINGGAAIDVLFGNDVMTTRIDGISYQKKAVKYSVSCEGDMSAASALEIVIKGSSASFDSGLLKTNITGLGIQFLNGADKLPLNTGAAKFDYLTNLPPTIYAVLARDPSVILSGGEFSATATMYVNYQ